jgi:hypothetical protein
VRGALALGALVLAAGCGRPCAVALEGNLSARFSGPAACPGLEQADGAWTLALGFDRPGELALEVALGLGESPTAGGSGSATATAPWSAVLRREPGCVASAGSDAVPAGAFHLELIEVSLGSRRAHGTLEVLQAVHALPGADCGAGDDQRLRLEF